MESKTITIWIFVFVFVSLSAYASDGGIINTNVSWYADITSGTEFYNADHANITIYTPNNQLYINQTAMSKISTGRYEYTYIPNETGNWYAYVEFYNSTGKIATASQSMEIRGQEDNNMILGSLILIPMILALIFLIGGATLNPEEHAAMKIALFLLSVPPFFISLNLATDSIVQFYPAFTEIQSTISNSVWVIGSMYMVIITYFVIYAFYKGIHKIAQKKEEKLHY